MYDYKLNEDGDLVIGPNGDFEMVTGDELILQKILFRLKTTKGDYLLEPDTGCSLEQFIGYPNTPDTWEEISSQISQEISKDGIYPDITVAAIDETTDEVIILIEIDSVEIPKKVLTIQSSLNLREGLVFSRIDNRLL